MVHICTVLSKLTSVSTSSGLSLGSWKRMEYLMPKQAANRALAARAARKAAEARVVSSQHQREGGNGSGEAVEDDVERVSSAES